MERTGSGVATKIRNWIIRQKNRGKPKGNIIVFQRTCCLCGEEFVVKIERRTGKILTKGIFYGGKIRLGIGMWSAYRWEGLKPDGTPNLVRLNPWYRELWYHLIDYKRILFRQYKDIEYFECRKCVAAWTKKRRKKPREKKKHD